MPSEDEYELISSIANVDYNSDTYAKNIEKIARSEPGKSLLFSWLYRAFDDVGIVSKEHAKDIKYAELSESLTPEIRGEIFRNSAPKINPDGEIKLLGNDIKCGSITMNLENGLWYRFSTKDKGNIFSLVASAEKCDKFEALRIVATYLYNEQLIDNNKSDADGMRLNYAIHANQKYGIDDKSNRNHDVGIKDEWVSLDKKPDNAPEFNAKKDLQYLLKDMHLNAVHEYRNKDNDIIGYTVRLEEKKGTGKKQVLPVSYCYNGALNEFKWHLKGFSDDGGKPLYGAEKLGKSKNYGKAILIVEGEKTADKASQIFKDHIVLSPMGGSSAINNVNWNILKGMEVVVWPDNDDIGKSSARMISSHIDVVNGFSGLSSIIDIDRHFSNKLPVKWDLADELPKDVSMRDIHTAVASSKNNDLQARNILNARIIDEDGKLHDMDSNHLMDLIKNYSLKNLSNFGIKNDIYIQRLEKEIDVIKESGYAKEFILAHQATNFARSEGMAIGTGRGSSTSSLVGYLMSIHEVDPIKHGLAFERFLSKGSNPDFDIDIGSSAKPKVENYLFSKYSEGCKISTITKNGLSTHPAAFALIGKDTKIEYSNISVDGVIRKRANIDKNKSEKLGIKKIDLLSSKALDKLKLCETRIKEETGNKVAWNKIKYTDQKSFDYLDKGGSKEHGLLGIYQIGSDYASKMISGCKVEKFSDIVNLQALIRPGVKDLDKFKNHESYNTNKDIDPKGILDSTRGVILYQEQIMELMHEYLGIDRNETNARRKEFEKIVENGDRNTCKSHHDEFVNICKNHGLLGTREAETLYKNISTASKFSFNKAHATAYAMMTFKTAYVAAHHPNIFKEVFIDKQKQITQNKDVNIKNNKEQKTEQGAIEAKLIEMQKERKKVKDPEMSLSLMLDQHKSMLEIANKVKNPENLSHNLRERLEYIKTEENKSYIENIRKMGKFLLESDKRPHDVIVKAANYRSGSAKEAYEFMLSSYHNRFVKSLNNTMKKIDNKTSVRVEGRVFNSNVKLLDHILEHHRDNIYLPHSKLLEKRQELAAQEPVQQKIIDRDIGR